MRTTAPSTIPTKKQFVSEQSITAVHFFQARGDANPVPGPSRSSSLGLPSISTTPPSTLCPSCVRPRCKAHSCPYNGVRTVYKGTARRNNGHDCTGSCIRVLRNAVSQRRSTHASAGVFVSRPDEQMQRRRAPSASRRRMKDQTMGLEERRQRREILVN